LLFTIDGVPASESDLAADFVEAGFVRTGSGRLVKRSTRPRERGDDWSAASSDA
jgi:hypothetical protein